MTLCYCGRQAKWGSSRCPRCEERYALWEEEEEGQQAMVHWLMALCDRYEEQALLERRAKRIKALAIGGALVVATIAGYLVVAVWEML